MARWGTEASAVLLALAACLSPSPAGADVSETDRQLRAGDRALSQDQPSAALVHYEQAAASAPADAQTHVRLGRTYYALGLYSRALEQFERASRLKSDSVTRSFTRAAVSKIRANQELLAQIENARSDPQRLYGLHAEAAHRMAEGQTYLALVEPHVRYLLDVSGEEPALLRYLADAHRDSGSPARAVHYYRRLLKTDARDPSVLGRLAESLVNVGRYDEAGRTYRQALRESVRRRDKLGIAEFEKKVRSLPTSTDRIRALLTEEDWPAAEAQLKRVLSLNPGDPWALTLLGTVYEEIGRDGPAERIYRKAADLRPDYPGVHYSLGKFYLLKRKRFDDALEELEKFKETLEWSLGEIEDPRLRAELEKDRVRAVRYLAYLHAEVMGRPARAAAELQALIRQTDSRDPELYYDLGAAYLTLKKRASAYGAFRKVIEYAPRDSELAREAENAIEYLRKHPDHGRYTGPYD